MGVGRIQTSGAAGLYMAGSGAERYITSGAEYMSISSGCRCDWVKVTESGQTVSSPVTFTDNANSKTYWVGHFFFSGGGVTVGSVVNAQNIQYYGTITGSQATTNTYDVLSCT